MKLISLSPTLNIIVYTLNDKYAKVAHLGNIQCWTRIMKSIKIPLHIKIANFFNEFKIKFLRSYRKRKALKAQQYTNNIDEMR